MFSKLNKFFSSVKLAIFLLIALASLSVVGTLINQGEPMSQYAKIFGHGLLFEVFYWLGFLNIFGSWYFITLSSLLVVNLVVSSANTFPRAFKTVFGPFPYFSVILERKNPKAAYSTLNTKKNNEDAQSSIETAFGKPLRETGTPGGPKELYFAKNSIFRMAPYIAHASVIVILAGVILNFVYGFRSYANLKEGQLTNFSYLLQNNKPVKLPFSLRLDKYRTVYYPDGIVKSYVSRISILNKNHISVLTKDIKVNQPLTYKGITMYQASYGHYRPDAIKFMTFNLVNDKAQGLISMEPYKLYNYNGSYLRLIPLPHASGNQIPFLIAVYKDPGNKPSDASKELFFNLGSYARGGKEIPFIYTKYKNTGFVYSGIKHYYYSGIEITRNSYTAVIWTGSIMLVLALFFSFFFNQSRYWVRLSPGEKGKGSLIEIIGLPRKKFAMFYKNFNDKIERIKRELNSK